MLKQTATLISMLALFLTACTGGKDSTVEGPGSLKIAPGETLVVDVRDIVALNVPDYTLSLRTINADFSTSKVLLDFTSLVAPQLVHGTKVQFIVPKNVAPIRPILVVADIPSLNTQMIDVLYDGDEVSRPGIASTLTYTLMKYYPGKQLQAYSSLDFHGIQNLIQARTDQLISESEHLNLATISFPKLMRYFKNGVAFNINFLSEIRRYGIDYSFNTTLPPGLLASDTPENSVIPYQYATGFKINGAPADIPPFNHTNNPPMLTPGLSQPNPGSGLYITEGNPISVSAQGFDLDDDFIDKNMIIQYVPRVLPSSLTSAQGFPIIPEPTPEYTILTNQTDSMGVDLYDTPKIAFNEALDTIVYPNTLSVDATLYPVPGAVPDTAYRNVYYSISDGMIRVPYRWNFKYTDINRQPKIVRDAGNKMNDPYFDDVIAPGELEVAAGTGWKVHGSHCESNPAFSYQTITSRADGPWSCAFRMIDPDIDDDPNAAADKFYYTLNASDNNTIIKVNGQKIWPQYVPPFTAPRVEGTLLSNCTTPDGKVHKRCGVGLYQVTIDNSVKAAAESKTSQTYNYDVVIYDRPLSIGGNSTSATLGRTIQLLPQPARLVNYAEPITPNGTLGLTLVDVPTNSYVRKDTYLSELLNLADPNHALNNLSDIGMGSGGLNSSLAGPANRSAFMAGTAYEITSFASQPHTIAGGTISLNPVTFQPISGSPGSLNLFGHSMTTSDVTTYSKPWEYDSTCSTPSNNKGSDWDQDAKAGWTFEIDAIDYDNVALAVGEASDPVHVQLSTNISTAINATGIQYCTYLSPNADPAYFQTYQATSTATVVDAEKCTWSGTPPTDMQPVPVYYTVTEAGQPVVKKWVYHRLRFKWQPKDQGLTNGKTVIDPPFFIKNQITSGLKLSGNRFQIKNDTLDLTTLPAPLNLFANRKDMEPCLTGLNGKAGTIHQLSNAPLSQARFGIEDENKVLIKSPTSPGALMGRFEAEFKVLGSRSITSSSFLQLVPYMLNCTTRDVDLASTPTIPPATVPGVEPAIWYSQTSDASNIPRLRFQTASDPGLVPMCFNYNLNPAMNSSNAEYNEVILIQNLSASAMTLNYALLGSCTSRSNLQVNPDQKYIAIASTCGGSHTLGQSLWSDANSSATVAYVANPTLASNGGLPIGTSLRLDLLPTFFQAGLAANFPADFDLATALFFDVSVFDTFRLDAGTGAPVFTGYFSGSQSNWLANNLSNAKPLPFAAPGFAYGLQVVDWDNQPNYLTIATPTPNPSTSDVFFRMAPGDSNRIQVFVKNHANVTFPVKVSDVSSGTPLEIDPYDVMAFSLIPPGSTPAGLPSFSGINRSDCTVTPASYPAVSTLNVSTLVDYKKCQFTWTPSVADDGKKFAYAFAVQDNNGATSSVMGIGGRHPAGAGGTGFSVSIPNDSLAKTNGPTVLYNLDIEALEANLSPFFTNSGGATVSNTYSSTGGGAGWSTVFSANTPVGTQSSCASPGSGFSCGLSVSNGDTLQSNIPIALTESGQQTFTVYAKDTNVTNALKTLTATPPNSVLIVDGPHKGTTFLVPSFSSMSLSANQNVGAGTASFSFSWTPTDSEANYLSNSSGFLIPMVIKDQSYSPASDSGFPTEFTVPFLQSTIWIWAKLSVSNSQPQVFYLNGTSEVPLDSANLSLQTGITTTYTIRVKDPDTARWNQSSDQTGFSPTYSGPAFSSLSSTGSPALIGNFIVQDFVISGSPTNSDIGSYTSPQVTINDPGDPSLGLAINPNGGNPPRAQVFSTGNAFNVPFTMQVIGKPQFLAPGITPTTSKAYAYAARPFVYPIAMSISRQNEMAQPFFIGIDQATAVTPIKRAITGANSTGIYVSHVGDTFSNNFIVKWPDSTSLNIIPSPGQDRLILLYGVKKSYCNVTDGSTYPAATLLRYNETTALMETCNLSLNHLNVDTSSSQLTITLVDNGQLASAVAPLTLSEMDRNFTQSPAPSDVTGSLSKHFADFIGRCTNCSTSPTTCNATSSGLALTGVNPATQACTEPGTGTARTGYLDYNYNSYLSRFTFNTASGFTVKKIYEDLSPSSVRTTSAMVNKGETLHFVSETAPPADTKYQYRWYVNGCLRSSGLVDGSPIGYDLKIASQMAGLNNDCTAQFGFAETSAAVLGKLVVRLSLVKGNELLTASSEASINTYVWNLSVLNSDPSIITTATYAPASPVSLSSQFTGTRNIQFASAVNFASKNFFAYTDLNASTGLKVRLSELDTSGNLATAANNLTLTCDSTFTSQPQWIGLQPQDPANGGKLLISASTNANYPISGANIAYSAKNQTCFTNAITLANPNVSAVNYDSAGSTVPAGYLGLSKHALSNRSLATFNAGGANSLYKEGTNDADFYLIDGKSASSLYWSYSLASIYSTNPPQFQTPYANNTVRRNIVAGTNLFQLMGANSANSTGWRGFVLPSTVVTAAPQLVATPGTAVMFADPAALPPPAANDCKFNGTPLDGIYVPTLAGVNVDTLYVLAASTGVGKIVAIKNVTGVGGTPTCFELGNVKNPSLLNGEYNSNLSKMIFDSARGTIYGIIDPGGGNGGQFYSLDVYSEQLATRDLSSTIAPYELIFSAPLNALYLFDNRKSTSPVLSPTLYKIW